MFVLDFLKLTDRYERKARLLPAALCGLLVATIAAFLTSFEFGLLTSVSVGGGTTASCAVALAYAASAAGRSYEKRLWPRWPYDAPTNRWLHPDDTSCSEEQKRLWYRAIKQLVGLDIPDVAARAGPEHLDRIINDAVRSLRLQYRTNNVGRLLSIHNEDYGFARNIAGLNLLCSLPATVIFTVVAWVLYFVIDTDISWGAIAVAELSVCVLLLWIMPGYVRQRADRYTESFFGALTSLDQSHQRGRPLKGTHAYS